MISPDCENLIEVEMFDFSTALDELKKGKKITREGWNGKGMFLYHVPSLELDTITDIAKSNFGDKVMYNAYIAIKTVNGTISMWTASQDDLLSEDWIIL